MNVRFGIALATALSMSVGACASSGSSGPSGGAAEPQATAGGEVLPEGTAPTDNMHTRSAALYLTQAQQNANPEEKEARFQEALQAARAGIEAEPGNPQSYLQAGQAYIGLGDLVAADSMLTRAEEIYPRYRLETAPLREQQWVQAYNQGINQLNAGNVEEAIALFENADMIYRERPEAMLNLGAAHARLGNTDEAVEAYADAVELMQSEAFEEQDSATQATWEENAEIAAFNMAQLLAQADRHDEAIAAYEAFIAENPDNVTALSNLAVVLMNAERTDSAMAIYDRLLSRSDLTARDYFTAGVGLFQGEAYEQAADAFRRAVELVPQSRDATYNLAQTLFLTEQFEELLPVAERLVELDPYNTNAYRFLAQGHVKGGQDEQAAVVTLEQMEALPFELTELQLQPMGGGGAVLTGSLQNRTLEPGTPVTVQINFLGENGADAGSVEVTVEAPQQEMSEVFRAELDSEEQVVAYNYEVLSGGTP